MAALLRGLRAGRVLRALGSGMVTPQCSCVQRGFRQAARLRLQDESKSDQLTTAASSSSSSSSSPSVAHQAQSSEQETASAQKTSAPEQTMPESVSAPTPEVEATAPTPEVEASVSAPVHGVPESAPSPASTPAQELSEPASGLEASAHTPESEASGQEVSESAPEEEGSSSEDEASAPEKEASAPEKEAAAQAAPEEEASAQAASPPELETSAQAASASAPELETSAQAASAPELETSVQAASASAPELETPAQAASASAPELEAPAQAESASEQEAPEPDPSGADEGGEEEEGDGYETEEELRARILATALDFVPQHGWSAEAIAAAAQAVGLSSAASGMFTNGAGDLVLHFISDGNAQLAKMLAEHHNQVQLGQAEPKETAEFLRYAVEARLRMLIPHIDTWPQAMSILLLPHNIPDSLKHLSTLIDDIWYYAGDRSTDMNWYTRRAALTGVYNTTELVMLQDSSPDFQDTWVFLDKRIQDIVNMANTAKQVQATGEAVVQGIMGAAVTLSNLAGMNQRR